MKLLLITLLSVLVLEAVDAPKYQRVHATTLAEYAVQDLKDTLKMNLKRVMEEEGLVDGLKFCSNNAVQITNMVGKRQPKGVLIKRVSNKLRNPSNKMDELDQTAWEYFESVKKDTGSYPKNFMSKLRSKSDRTFNIFRFYEPLIISKACLQCHGESIQPMVNKEIQKLYSNDKAIGYKEGDLRGLIVVQVTPQAIYNRANQVK